MHCNLRPPEPRQLFPALIATPCQVWICWTYPLPYYTVFAADTLLKPWPWPLTLWPLTLNICSVSSVTWWNSVPNLNAIKQSVAELSRFQCLTLWPWTCYKCCARLWDNFHQVWPSTVYPCLNYSVFWCWHVMSRCDLDLWPVDLESSWYNKCHVIKVCTKFEQNQAIPGWITDNFANFCTRYVTPWPWPSTSWPWTFTAFRVSCI